MEKAKLMVLDHPLIQHKLTHIRDKRTGPKEFRELVEELALLMAYEVTRDLPLQEVEVRPVAPAKGRTIAGKNWLWYPSCGPVWAWYNGILKLIPTAKVGHIGIYRDRKPWRRWTITASCRRISRNGI